MRSLKKGLAAFLNAQPALAAHVGSRIYGGKLPDDPTLPAISATFLPPDRLRALDGPTGFTKAHVQLSVWSRSWDEASAIADVLRDLLDDYAGPMGAANVETVIWSDTDQDLYEPETKTWHIPCEVEIQFKE
jgi:hypothetical protein